MKRSDYIKSLPADRIPMYLYLHKKATGMGLKKVTEWCNEEVHSDRLEFEKFLDCGPADPDELTE